MKFTKTVLFFLLSLNLSFPLSAQIQNAVKWKITLDKSENLSVGDKFTLKFQASIDKGYHIYAAKASVGGPLPTTLGIDNIKGAKTLGALKDVGKPISEFDEIFETQIYYFKYKADYTQEFLVTAEDIAITGYLDYQVCDTMACVPGTKDFSYTFKAAAAKPGSATSDTAALDNPVASETDSSGGVSAPSAADSASQQLLENIEFGTPSKDEGILWFMLVAFGSGLLALLTPCVFPMIPMTVSFFTKQSKSRGDGIRKALIYSGSIVVIYVLLGVIVSATVGAAALNEWSTSWYFNIFFFLICIIFAISFFGMFEITLPASLVNAMDKKSEQGGLVGIFFMAFTLALVSFSCTGPIVGTLLVEAAGGSYLRPVFGMAAYSLAFAIPFGLFALFPSWLNTLPKSGGWLNSVKVILGFLELALALKFLSVADMTYEWGILDREIYLLIWVTIFLMMGAYLMNWFKLPHDSELSFISVPRFMMAMSSFAFSFYLVMGIWGHPLKMLSGLLPPQSPDQQLWFSFYQGSGNGGGNHTGDACADTGVRKYAESLHAPHGLCAFFDYEEGMAYARKSGKPVIIDFTGKGCVNCRKMEDFVWVDPRVLKILKEDFVLISLFVDLKRDLPENEKYTTSSGKKIRTVGDKWAWLQEEKYHTNAQPQYVLLDHQEKLLNAPVGYDRDIEKYIAFLNAGKTEFEKRKGAN
jgi:thiol:disulfide interchange protein